MASSSRVCGWFYFDRQLVVAVTLSSLSFALKPSDCLNSLELRYITSLMLLLGLGVIRHCWNSIINLLLYSLLFFAVIVGTIWCQVYWYAGQFTNKVMWRNALICVHPFGLRTNCVHCVPNSKAPPSGTGIVKWPDPNLQQIKLAIACSGVFDCSSTVSCKCAKFHLVWSTPPAKEREGGSESMREWIGQE